MANMQQTVALLGAHTLGHADLRNSGFMGPWVSNENKLDNEYYRTLVSPTRPWRQRQLTSGNFQWNQEAGVPPDPSFMLNADISLLKDVMIDNNGQSSCDINTCADSPSAQHVREYANDNSIWLADFFEAYQIIENSEGIFFKHINRSLARRNNVSASLKISN